MTPDTDAVPWIRRTVWTPVGLLLVALAVIWSIEIVDSVALDDRLQQNGIRPRHSEGLDGVLWTPFLHSDFAHVASNSAPLMALGGLVAIRGMRYWARSTALIIVGGGGLTWLLAADGNHIGASGVVFGYFGAIVGAAVFERRPKVLAPALLALGFYGGMVAGVVPQESISWEGHLFGTVAGIIAARWLAEPRQARVTASDEAQPWEFDEPWLD